MLTVLQLVLWIRLHLQCLRPVVGLAVTHPHRYRSKSTSSLSRSLCFEPVLRHLLPALPRPTLPLLGPEMAKHKLQGESGLLARRRVRRTQLQTFVAAHILVGTAHLLLEGRPPQAAGVAEGERH